MSRPVVSKFGVMISLWWMFAMAGMAYAFPRPVLLEVTWQRAERCDLSFATYEEMIGACTAGDGPAVVECMQRGATADMLRPPYILRPLDVALMERHEELANFLITTGARTHTLADGQSALHLAVARNCPQVVKFLLRHGANPNEPFRQPVSRTFLKWVNADMLRWVLVNDGPVFPIMLAASQENAEPLARLLIRAGARTEVRTKTAGLWTINFASHRGDVGMMRVLMGLQPKIQERTINISISKQNLRVINADGNVIFATKVSTGKKGHETKKGRFVVTDKLRSWKSTIYPAEMPFFLRLSCEDFGMHQGVVPGYPASHGCIRVPAGNATKLFDIARRGDVVNIDS